MPRGWQAIGNDIHSVTPTGISKQIRSPTTNTNHNKQQNDAIVGSEPERAEVESMGERNVE
jgi:hypothetical protein